MKLLFICTHNRCRSILAEAITRHLVQAHQQQNPTSQLELQAYSAGSQPAGVVHPLSLQYLQEAGIAIDGLISQSWDEFEDSPPDIAITVCDSAAGEICPLWMGDCPRVHWGLPDPSRVAGSDEVIATAFRDVMATINDRIHTLIQRLDEQPLTIGQCLQVLEDLKQ